MELTQLTRKQQIALVALVEAIAMADGTVAEGEQREIGQIAAKLGDDTYRDLLNDADERFSDKEGLQEFLQAITDQGARQLIFGTAMEETMLAPSVNHAQSELLTWLREAWDITVEEK
jgi:hypothetical protein